MTVVKVVGTREPFSAPVDILAALAKFFGWDTIAYIGRGQTGNGCGDQGK